MTTLLISMYFYFSVKGVNVEIIKPVIKYLKLIGIIIGLYFIISIFYFISKKCIILWFKRIGV